MFYIKKNGVIRKLSGRVQSFLASAIGFTPPTGMSATNVQDAIEEVNTKVNAIDGKLTDMPIYVLPLGSDVNQIRKTCFYEADAGITNNPTNDSGYVGLCIYVGDYYKTYICSSYNGGHGYIGSTGTGGSLTWHSIW